VRTVTVPGSAKAAEDDWLTVARIEDDLISRCVMHTGSVRGSGISEQVVWWVVRQYAKKAAIDKVAPQELRSTCASALPSSGWRALARIQFVLGHRSVESHGRFGSR
jgi:site-specific recombinase XerD